MRTGRLRHPVVIQRLTEGTLWGEEDSWEDYAAVWASVEPLKGAEYYAAQQVNAEVTGKVVMRYLSGVVPKMRVVFGTRTFEILSVINPDERNRELQLLVKEPVT